MSGGITVKTTVYLIRHGQSVGNLHDQFIGHTDIELTALGKQQAEITAQYLREIPADRIYSSDLMRAYDTACATAKLKNMTVTKTAGMREIYGGQWEGKRFPTLGTQYKEDFSNVA